jgi:hypothetical protein
VAPSEFDLRSALHEGEGDGVDAGRVIARARAVRATRRTRWASVAASVVVAGALGTGIGALVHFSGSPSAGSAGSAAGANAADSAASATGSAAGGRAGLAAPQPAAPPASGEFHGPAQGPEKGSKVCEDTVPVPATPPASGPATSRPLLPPDTEAVVVCGYRIAASGAIARHHHQDRLVGPAARELAQSLNAAALRPDRTCPPAFPTRMLSITVNRPDIAPHQPVIVTYDSTCGATATDGTAVRYGWTPPADLAAKLDALTRP